MPSNALAQSGPGDAALGALIGTAAMEVDALSDVANRLHALIARHVAQPGAHEQSIEDAQMIDYLTQHLEALGEFLGRLSAATPPDVLVDAASARAGVRLAALARRLVGDTDPNTAPGQDPGDCELF